MKRFKMLNNVVGWVVFAIAAITYLLTIEPTASFWDCGEFISTADKLEVGHPPGAPFFMLTAKFFTLFASDQAHVAMMVNSFSAICSALCILFLFWTITHLARKLVVKDSSEISLAQTIAILGAGSVGALAYTFSDTFWFSAVEGEVYAYSSLFTAVVFWAILKWEDVADQPYANRWLVLIAYLMGLSVGVHLLNLLTIPALVLVYYFKKYKATITGAIIAMAISCVILVFILYGVIPGFVQVAGWFELFFVNTLGFSFNVGTIIYAVLLISCLIWGIYETMNFSNPTPVKVEEAPKKYAIPGQKKTQKNANQEENFSRTKMNIAFVLSILLLGIPFLGGRVSVAVGLLITAGLAVFLFKGKKYVSIPLLNTIIICCMVILLGYSTYATIIIRSAANTPMDQNSPDDVFALKSYLNREQYGDTPLLFGESYASELKRKKTARGWELDITEGENIYAKKIKTKENEPDSYEAYDRKKKYNYDVNMFFPRMYSKQPAHIEVYKLWGGNKGKKVRYESMGEEKTKVVPTFGENLKFFFTYQVNFMYWRYFMWNFVGRQNDIQGHGGILHGNWISGINFIDSVILGDQSSLPDDLKNNKGRNVYFFLPLLLGILGILYQFSKGKSIENEGAQSFWITFILFFMTGLAIVLYLNQTPYQPRERDYAYAGSFYAFSIWIGLGVLFIYDVLKGFIDKKFAATAAFLVSLGVPVLMAEQNWDDHDRSGRFTCRDFGQNYLLSLEPNAIIFTNGDNDTFPLWYNQEVEGAGTDARVANLSYLQMGWYVDQMKRQAYESDPLPLSLMPQDYMNGKMDVVYLTNLVPEINAELALEIAKDPAKYSQYNPYKDDNVNFIPSKRFYVEVDKDEVLASGCVNAKDSAYIVDRVYMNTSKSYLGKHEMVIMDLLQNNKWKRPIYYAVTVGSDSYLGLQKHLSLEGMAYRILPKTGGVFAKNESVNIDRTFDNMMHKFKWGGIAENPNIYMDENNLRMTSTLRFMFVRLVDAIMSESRKAEMEGKYSEILRWALTQNPTSPSNPEYMRYYRTMSRAFFDNDRLDDRTNYSDSMLIANAPSIAAQIAGCSDKLSRSELINKLEIHEKSIDNNKIAALKEANKAKAIEALDYCQKVMPVPQIPYTSASLMMARQYVDLGEGKKAEPIIETMMNTSKQYLSWITNLNLHQRAMVMDEFRENFSIFAEILQLQQTMGATEEEMKEDYELYKKYWEIYSQRNR